MPSNHLRIDKTQGALSRTLDFVCLAGAFAATGCITSLLSREKGFVWPAPTSSDIAGWPAQYIVLLLSTLIGWSVVSGYCGIHNSERSDLSSNHFGRSIRAGLLWVAATGFAIFLFKLGEVSRLFVLSYVALASILIALRDYGETVVARRIYERQGLRRTAVVIGAGAQASWLRQFLLDNYCPQPYALVRQVDPCEFADGANDGTLRADEGGRLSREAAEVFVAAADIGADASGLFPRLFERGTEAHIVPGIFDASIFKLALGNIGGIPVITLHAGTLSGLEAAIKRAFDFLISAILLAIAAPVLAVIATSVKLSSPGPVLFRQERVGKGGRHFLIYKFRTMRRNAEEILEANPELHRKYVESNYKLPKGEDPRVTLIGRILRELSLDELPQLFNVLKGDMSLVGPRPVVPAEIGKYGEYAALLLSVQPGLTGQWQVSGRSDIADYARRVRLDMEYIRDQSIATDLQILFRTVPVVLSREGAY